MDAGLSSVIVAFLVLIGTLIGGYWQWVYKPRVEASVSPTKATTEVPSKNRYDPTSDPLKLPPWVEKVYDDRDEARELLRIADQRLTECLVQCARLTEQLNSSQAREQDAIEDVNRHKETIKQLRGKIAELTRGEINGY